MIRTIATVILMAAAGLARGESPAAASPEAQIRAALAAWVDAANRGDYAATMKVWAPDMIGWAPEGPDDSYDREMAYLKLPPQPVTTTYALKIDEVIVDGALAVVRDTWTQTTKQKAGADKVSTFRSFEVWRRQADGVWKISRWIDGPPRPSAAQG